ncbi:hypothetical protein [Terribacillus saccharophilus]|uniref:hypothetical protein n=1 Tax=Terribacillus saccharophilus TaxID=361277 RepID=UPI003981AFC2
MRMLSKSWYSYAALSLLVLVLAGCASNTNGSSEEDSKENLTAASASVQQNVESEGKNQPGKSEDESESERETKESDSTESGDTADASQVKENIQSSEITKTSEDTTDTYETEGDNLLAGYSAEEIEYARVWLQLGPNQQIDGLYIRHIPAGTALEPDYFPSVTYPEDVVQLSGSRIVDGSVTYSSNGDGTINVYNVPLPGRWYGGSPTPPEGLDESTMTQELEDIITHTELVYVDPGNEEAVIKFIDLISN